MTVPRRKTTSKAATAPSDDQDKRSQTKTATTAKSLGLLPLSGIETRPKPNKVVRRLGESCFKRKSLLPKKHAEQETVAEYLCGTDESFVLFSALGFKRQFWKLHRKATTMKS